MTTLPVGSDKVKGHHETLHFEELEDELKYRLLHMGSLVEEMIHWAVYSLLERTTDSLEKVHESEKEVNRLHIEIDDRCLKLLALYQPAAADLRFVIGATKINSDLERIGDQAVNIAQTTAAFAPAAATREKTFRHPAHGGTRESACSKTAWTPM